MRSPRRVKMWLFVLAALMLAAAAIGVFAGVRFWRAQDHYRVVFSGSVTGLAVGARVERWGIRIGEIDSIRFAPDRPQTPVVVHIAVDSGAHIPVGARGSLEIDGLTFVKYLDLVGGDPAGPRLPPGSEIPGSPGELETVLDKANAIMTSVGEVLDTIARIGASIEDVAGEPNRQRISSFLEAADRAATATADAAADIRALTADLRGNTAGLSSATRDVDQASELARTAMSDVRDAARDLRTAASDLTTLTRRTGRNLDLLFSRLRSTTSSIQSLIRSLEENPARLLRGRSPPERSVR